MCFIYVLYYIACTNTITEASHIINDHMPTQVLVPAIVVPVVGGIAITVVLAFVISRRRHRRMVKAITEKQRSEIPRSDILGECICRVWVYVRVCMYTD